jgi:DnaK suppressor protein
MTEQEHQELLELIDKEIATLNDKITELKDFTEPVSPDNAIGRVSRMDAINNKSIFDASLRNTQQRLMQLQQIKTLKNDNNFGICTGCYQQIPFERLKIRPEIRLCADCLKGK